MKLIKAEFTPETCHVVVTGRREETDLRDLQDFFSHLTREYGGYMALTKLTGDRYRFMGTPARMYLRRWKHQEQKQDAPVPA